MFIVRYLTQIHTHTHTRITFLAPSLRCTNGFWTNTLPYYNLSSYNKHTSEKITTDQNIVYKDIINKTYTYLHGNIIYVVWRTSTSGGLPTRVFDIYLPRYYTVGLAKKGKNVLYHHFTTLEKHLRYIPTVGNNSMFLGIFVLCAICHWTFIVSVRDAYKGFFFYIRAKTNARPRDKSYFFPFLHVFHYYRHQFIILCMRVCVQATTYNLLIHPSPIPAHTLLNHFISTTRWQTPSQLLFFLVFFLAPSSIRCLIYTILHCNL